MNIVLLNKKSRNSTVIKFKNDVPYISYKAMDEIHVLPVARNRSQQILLHICWNVRR